MLLMNLPGTHCNIPFKHTETLFTVHPLNLPVFVYHATFKLMFLFPALSLGLLKILLYYCVTSKQKPKSILGYQ